MLQPEQIDHINLINWFNFIYPELDPDFHHFANERSCSQSQGRLLKRMGVKKGVADFFLALPQNGFHGLWIELKVGKNKPTKEQILFLSRKLARGYHALTVWGEIAAKHAIVFYLKEYDTERYENELKKLCENQSIC